MAPGGVETSVFYNTIVPESTQVDFSVTNHQLDLPVDLETCVRLEVILLNEA